MDGLIQKKWATNRGMDRQLDFTMPSLAMALKFRGQERAKLFLMPCVAREEMAEGRVCSIWVLERTIRCDRVMAVCNKA